MGWQYGRDEIRSNPTAYRVNFEMNFFTSWRSGHSAAAGEEYPERW
jgi:hypothetical protein